MTIIGGVVYKKYMIFKVFFAKFFSVARSYLVVVIIIKMLIMGALVNLETRFKVRFLKIWGIF